MNHPMLVTIWIVKIKSVVSSAIVTEEKLKTE